MKYRINRRAFLIVIAVSSAFLGSATGYATPVFVEASGEIGRGISELRGSECMIIIPRHVAGEMKEVTVYAMNGAQGKALFVKNVGEREDDLALFRGSTNADAICDNTESAMLKAMPGSALFVREQSGAIRTERIEITRRSQRSLELSFVRKGAREAQGLSGSVIYENGKAAGVLLQVGTTDDEPALARRLDYVAALEGSWVLGPGSDVSRIRDSLEILQSIVTTRPSGDMGQIAAVEELVRNGSALAGADFRGIGLASAMMDHGNFNNARMQAAKLANASLRSATISAARFDFADLKNVTASSAVAREARFYYAEADDADFTNLSGSRSNWTAASARSAKFRNADLSGASFLFADLTGADFTGADLRQTVFIGAILNNARFDNAIFDRTDFTAASSDAQAFNSKQRANICATLSDGDTKIILMRTIPSTRFQSGKEFDELEQLSLYLPVSIDLLPRCANRDLKPVGFPPIDTFDHTGEPIETVTEYFRMDYESEPYDEIGLKSRFRTRVRDQVDRVKDAWENANFLRIESDRAQELESVLKARINATGFEGKFNLNDYDALELIRIKYTVESYPEDRWAWMARRWLDREKREHKSALNPAGTGRWERFFPADVHARELTETHIDLFRQWSLNRADAIPSPVFIRFTLSSRARQSLRNATHNTSKTMATEMSIKPFDALDNGRLADLPGGDTVDRSHIISVNLNPSALLMLKKPTDKYNLKLDVSDMTFLRDAQQLELQAKIIDARFFDKDPKVGNDQVVVFVVEPIAISARSRDGSSHVFTF